jgi:predicted SprT family Zn-dependent metalloprotease
MGLDKRITSRYADTAMDFNSAAQLARQLIARHGLRGWTFRYNRGKRTLGMCDYTRKRIELSQYFVAHNGEGAVRDTILHEIAHALAGEKAGHGPKWRAVCMKIGAIPERLDHTAVMPKGHWSAICPGCGAEHRRFRRPLLGRTYICLACGAERGRLHFHIPAGLAPAGSGMKSTA